MEPDASIVLAAERCSTGANIHQIRNLLQTYIDLCYLGEVKKSEKAKKALYAALRKNIASEK